MNEPASTHNVTKLTATQEAALAAVMTEPEIQKIAERLAHFGLGIALPHMHTAAEDFADLPPDMVQVEQAGVVSFIQRTEAYSLGLIPVGWRWIAGDGLTVAAGCSPFMYCNPNVQGHAFVQGHTNY